MSAVEIDIDELRKLMEAAKARGTLEAGLDLCFQWAENANARIAELEQDLAYRKELAARWCSVAYKHGYEPCPDNPINASPTEAGAARAPEPDRPAIADWLDEQAQCLHDSHVWPPTGQILEPEIEEEVARVRQWATDLRSTNALSETTFQSRVQPWMQECFGAEIAGDRQERNHRFLEESLELVQACGCTADEAHQLVDYVFSRPVGEPHQETGGVMVTLAALCLANDLDMHRAGEDELARIWTKVPEIRLKHANKPPHSPLPATPDAATPLGDEQIDAAIRAWFNSRGSLYFTDPEDHPDWSTWRERMRGAVAALSTPALPMDELITEIVEDLRQGDDVMTLDDDPQPENWSEMVPLSTVESLLEKRLLAARHKGEGND